MNESIPNMFINLDNVIANFATFGLSITQLQSSLVTAQRDRQRQLLIVGAAVIDASEALIIIAGLRITDIAQVIT